MSQVPGVTAHPALDPEDVLDSAALWELVPRPLLGPLVEIYREDSARLLIQIEKAIVARDGPLLQFGAHTFKGSTQTFAARLAGPSAVDLELAARTLDFARAADLLERLKGEVAALLRGLTRLVETTPP